MLFNSIKGFGDSRFYFDGAGGRADGSLKVGKKVALIFLKIWPGVA